MGKDGKNDPKPDNPKRGANNQQQRERREMPARSTNRAKEQPPRTWHPGWYDWCRQDRPPIPPWLS